MNRFSWENMRPRHRHAGRDEGQRPYYQSAGHQGYQEGPRAYEEDRFFSGAERGGYARDQSSEYHRPDSDYYGYESHARQQYDRPASPPRGYAADAGSARGPEFHADEERWHRPLFSDLSDQDSEGYQYFGGGRQNYAGVESGGGPLAMQHYLPQASSAAFYDWDRSLWGGREPSPGLAEQNYYGRGPRDYERSDERIREEICERLCDDPFVDPSDVAVSVESGAVKLEGTIEDRPQKYRVEDIVEDCRGVREVQNHLAVSPRPSEAALGDWVSDSEPKRRH